MSNILKKNALKIPKNLSVFVKFSSLSEVLHLAKVYIMTPWGNLFW